MLRRSAYGYLLVAVASTAAPACQFPTYTFVANDGGAEAGSGGTASFDAGDSDARPFDATPDAPGDGDDAADRGTGDAEDDFCGAEHLFCDDFEDGVADGWVVSGGVWGVVDAGGDTSFRGGGSEEAVIDDATWADQIVEARVQVVELGGATDGYRAGIIGRYESSSAFYVFALGGDGNATLRKSTSAPSGTIGTCGPVPVAFEVGQWLLLRLEVTGPSDNVTIRTFVDGEPVHSCTTTSNTVESGSVGLLTFGSSTQAGFDDVRVSLP